MHTFAKNTLNRSIKYLGANHEDIICRFLNHSPYKEAVLTYLGDDNYNVNKTKVTFTIVEVSKKNTPIDLNIDVYEDAALVMVDVDKSATGLVKFYMVGKETGEEYTMYMDVIDGHVETFTGKEIRSGVMPTLEKFDPRQNAKNKAAGWN